MELIWKPSLLWWSCFVYIYSGLCCRLKFNLKNIKALPAKPAGLFLYPLKEKKMKITGAEIIIRSLEAHGVNIIAGIPGGSNLPLYNAIHKSGIRHILARHEQGAGFIAQGMARSTGKPAVCFATSGPGATNLITALADANMDSIPIIAITGQVPLSMMGKDSFQEVDIFSMAKSFTKKCYLAESADDLEEIIADAFYTAMEGRPGPILIDIPKNVQQEYAIYKNLLPRIHKKIKYSDDRIIFEAAKMINNSRRPVLYIGGGVIMAEASEEIKILAEKNCIPTASTLMGLGVMPSGHAHNLGMLGMHGDLSTNLILDKADLLIAVGVRFDDRAVGRAIDFCRHASIIHIDIDHSEIGKIKETNIAIISDAGESLRKLIPLINNDCRTEWTGIADKIISDNKKIDSDLFDFEHPFGIIKKISGIMDDNTIITTDVGQHQMWTAQAYNFKSPRTFFTSGGLGTMGFGLPCAIGAALANPDKTVLCISGDGSILMNIQELATLADYNLNIKIIIMNNGQLGLVRQQQELFYEGNFCASKFITSPDFAGIAEKFGIQSIDLGKVSFPELELESALMCSGPVLINIPIYEDHNVLPMVAPGKANIEMIV